jgi:hypothetical protein
MMEKTSENRPRWKTRIASISFTRWHSGADLKNYGRRTLKARRPDNENPNQSRSELGWQIAVDLETDADFDERRCGPGHDPSPSGSSERQSARTTIDTNVAPTQLPRNNAFNVKRRSRGIVQCRRAR